MFYYESHAARTAYTYETRIDFRNRYFDLWYYLIRIRKLIPSDIWLVGLKICFT